jgi:hypothetical protein
MSAGEAAKEFVKASLLAMGKDFAVKSVGHLAMGVGALAIGGPFAGASAAQHFQAAAIYGAGAVLAGAGARAMGAGDSPSGARSSAGAGAGGARAGSSLGGGSRGGDLTRNVTVILGSDYSGMSERERRSRMAGAVERGMGADRSTTIRDG